MFRLIFVGFIVSTVFVEGDFSPKTDITIEVSQNQTTEIDPIITGHSISDEHKRKWLIQNAKFKECGLCGEGVQAYPGD